LSIGSTMPDSPPDPRYGIYRDKLDGVFTSVS
jgi:hypothetical protein